MESLQLLISTQLDALLAQRAVQEGQTKAEVVRAALEAYLAPQTPLERSLQTLERTLNDRLIRLEKLVRQGIRQENPPNDRGGTGSRSTPGAFPEVPQTLEEFGDEEDEADEILPEFLEFASPAVQHYQRVP